MQAHARGDVADSERVCRLARAQTVKCDQLQHGSLALGETIHRGV
jgi:hypothetical protein